MKFISVAARSIACMLLTGGATGVHAQTLDVNFSTSGKYLISLPATWTSPPLDTAEDLFAAVPNVVDVGKWDTLTNLERTWDGATCTGAGPEPGAGACGSSCFCIDTSVGAGFMVEVSAPGMLSINGADGFMVIPLDAAGPTSLSGIHYVSVPFNGPLSDASDLVNDIGGLSVVINVQRFDTATEGFEVYPGVNFPIVAGEGYVARVAASVPYSPALTSATLTTRVKALGNTAAGATWTCTNPTSWSITGFFPSGTSGSDLSLAVHNQLSIDANFMAAGCTSTWTAGVLEIVCPQGHTVLIDQDQDAIGFQPLLGAQINGLTMQDQGINNATSIPTLPKWGMIVMVVSLVLVGVLILIRRM